MAEFDAQREKHQFDAQRQRHAFDASKRRHTFSATAPSEVQEDTSLPLVDDFEDGGVSEYSGDTGLFTVDGTSPVPNGSFSLKTDAGTSTALIISTAGLDNYLDQDETMAVQLHPVSGNDSRMGVAFFVQDYNNFYLLAAAIDLGNFQLFKKSGGSFTQLTKVNVSLSQGTEYRVEATPQSDGTLLGELFDESASSKLASISATDTTYSDGGVGWRVASGGGGSTGDAFDYGRLI